MSEKYMTGQFKAVTKDTKQWVIGDLTRTVEHYPNDKKVIKYFINSNDIWFGEDGLPMSQSGMCVEVDAETICQFSGLYDGTPWDALSQTEQEEFLRYSNQPSDWRGKPIFTSDVCQIDNEMLICARRKADYVLERSNSRPITLTLIHKCRVLGNLLDGEATGGVHKAEITNELPY